jgi:hypothetical protein
MLHISSTAGVSLSKKSWMFRSLDDASSPGLCVPGTTHPLGDASLYRSVPERGVLSPDTLGQTNLMLGYART